MIPLNVSIVKRPEVLLNYPLVDGTTQKRVEFQLLRPEAGWLFPHVITCGGPDFDRMIDKLKAYGGVGIDVAEYQGEEPTLEWKDKVVWAALLRADEISWDGINAG